MNIAIASQAKTFQPIDVTFTLETQAELNALGSLLNCWSALNGIEKITGERRSWVRAYEALADAGADIHQIQAIIKCFEDHYEWKKSHA